MAYKTIFDIRPKKENKKEFCQRIVELLNSISFCVDGCICNNGEEMLNEMFKYNKLNPGFSTIDDLLGESDKPYANIFSLARMNNHSIC